MSASTLQVRKVRDMVWEVPKQGGMRVPGRHPDSQRLTSIWPPGVR